MKLTLPLVASLLSEFKNRYRRRDAQHRAPVDAMGGVAASARGEGSMSGYLKILEQPRRGEWMWQLRFFELQVRSAVSSSAVPLLPARPFALTQPAPRSALAPPLAHTARHRFLRAGADPRLLLARGPW